MVDSGTGEGGGAEMEMSIKSSEVGETGGIVMGMFRESSRQADRFSGVQRRLSDNLSSRVFMRGGGVSWMVGSSMV